MEAKKEETNTIEYLNSLLDEKFKFKSNVPENLKSIKTDGNEYGEIDLSCGLKIPKPTVDIANNNNNIDAALNKIDSEDYSTTQNLHDIVYEIMSFVTKYHVFYVQTTDNNYKNIKVNNSVKKMFFQEAQELDDKINGVIPTIKNPITRITKIMKFDNSVQEANNLFSQFTERLARIYNNRMATIFKYIVLGEDV